eukprot:277138-Rhodomonas_salina.1
MPAAQIDPCIPLLDTVPGPDLDTRYLAPLVLATIWCFKSERVSRSGPGPGCRARPVSRCQCRRIQEWFWPGVKTAWFTVPLHAGYQGSHW